MKKDYSNVKKVLDNALTGYHARGGKITREKVVQGARVFTHTTTFACVKQPAGSNRDTYYVLHHMRAYVRDQQFLTLPSQVQQWASRLSMVGDDKVREEIYDIQKCFATKIVHEVVNKSGTFYCRFNMPNRDIDTYLATACDDRPFITQEGCPVVIPGRMSQKE